MREIKLTGKKYPGRVTLVDDEDYERLAMHKWFCAGDPRTLYAMRTVWAGGRFTKERMHHVIVSPPPGMEVDHRDGDGLNNVRANLRICTHAENMRNRKRQVNNTSGYMGVQVDTKTGLWRATIFIDGKLKKLGVFADPAEAAKVRDAAAREHYGEFASLNF